LMSITLPCLTAQTAKAHGERSPVAPSQAQIKAAVDEAYAKFKTNTDGKNADYIPELAKVDSKLFGIVVVTTDGQMVAVGDVNTAFSIQSISKVFSLALAMNELGPDKVFEKIGSEPTGRPFNSVDAVVDMPTHTGNPLVNAGAIAGVRIAERDDAHGAARLEITEGGGVEKLGDRATTGDDHRDG